MMLSFLHPREDVLADFASDALDARTRNRIATHLRDCPTCQATLRFHAQINEAVKRNPLTAMTEITQHNLEMIKKMQDSFFKAAGLAGGQHGKAEDSDKNRG